MRTAMKVAAVGLAALVLLTAVYVGRAEVARDLQNLKVLSQCFSTRVSGLTQIATLKDITRGRYLILKVAADAPADNPTLFKNDWVLVYQHADGTEDRASCDGIAKCESAEAGEFGTFYLGEAARVSFTARQIHLGLAFYVEPDVETVQLFRIGWAEPLVCPIGTKRPFSVFITTNSKPDLLPQVKQTLEEGGYQVTAVSTALNADHAGVTILYGDKVEAAAREISQRLMTKFQMVPALQPLGEDVASEVDILIWIGK